MEKYEGLNSKEALKILETDLTTCLEGSHRKRSTWRWMVEAWWPSSHRSLFRVTSTVFTVLMILALVSSPSSTRWDLLTAAVISALTVLNLFIRFSHLNYMQEKNHV